MTAEVVVIGGGLAGSAAAITLARGGRSVVLLESERDTHHKVCGEFLSAEAIAELAAFDVHPAGVGAEHIHTVRVAGASGGHTSHALPFTALSIKRRSLDAMLLDRAEQAGVEVCGGWRAESLEREGEQWRVGSRRGNILAQDVVLATGKHDMRGHPRPLGTQSGLVALKMYFQLARAQRAALEGHVELLLYPGGYAGLQLVELGVANLCGLIEERTFRRLSLRNNFFTHIAAHCPHLAERLNGARPLLETPLAVASIPYGFLRRDTQPGLWCVGDQAAVIPSFTGDGMSIALFSGRRAAEALLAGTGAERFQQALHHDLIAQVEFATRLSQFMVTRTGRFAAERVLPLWPRALEHIARRTRLRA